MATSVQVAFAADPGGPTPYPTRLQDYPGKGWAQNFSWMAQNRQRFWAQRESQRGAVVFAGDSLTAGWAALDRDFAGLPVANRGIGGDTSRSLLFRFREDVLDLSPRAVVLLIGTNDLSARQDPRDTIANVSQMLEWAQAQRPTMPVVLCTVPPRDNPKSPIDQGQLDALNAALSSLATKWPQVSVLNLHPAMGRDGGLDATYFGADRLHFSREGYRRWHAVLAERFTVLGIH